MVAKFDDEQDGGNDPARTELVESRALRLIGDYAVLEFSDAGEILVQEFYDDCSERIVHSFHLADRADALRLSNFIAQVIAPALPES